MTTYRLMDGASGRPGTGSSGTQPPTTGVSYSGGLIVGCVFGVSQGGMWFQGYWYFVATTNGEAGSTKKFALWQIKNGGTGSQLVPGSVVTSGTLSAGWNFVALSTPLLLSPYATGSATTYGAVYLAAGGGTYTGGFPESKNQFGTGNPYSGGITNGPLTGFSSESGSLPAGGSGAWSFQQPFNTSTDPASAMPTLNDSDANLWLDVQVSDTAPGGTQNYRTFPNSPLYVVPGQSASSTAYTLGLEFTLSQSAALSKIWHYSPPGVTILPSRCAIWDVASQTVVAGTDNTSPSWLLPGGSAASAGAGWVYCDYSGAGVTLNASQNYKASTFTSDNTDAWFLAQVNVWGTGQAFPSGVTQGPLHTLGNSASTQGQDSWHQSTTWHYPDTGNISSGGTESPEFDGIDVEVSASASTAHTATASLTVAPSFTASRVLGKFRTAALTVTPGRTAARVRGKFRTASLTVTPGFAETHSHTGGSAHTRSASLTVTPSFTTARAQGHARRAALTVTPVTAAHRAAGRVRSALLSLLPDFRATGSGGQQPKTSGSWWQLRDVLVEQAAYADYYRSQPPMACPNDGEPLTPGPGNEPVIWFCKFDGWSYPDDYDPDIHSGM